jgi:hypothetical protein
MNIRLKKNISFFLLLIVSLFIVPVELIHDLYGHEDTICFPHSNTTIEKKHHHCDILKYVAPYFIANANLKYSDKLFEFTIRNTTEYTYLYSQIFISHYLRGPPLNLHI